MDDVLLPVGTIVKVTHDDMVSDWLIIGKRVIKNSTNFGENIQTAWDYKSVPFPEGYTYTSGYFYFNHPEIESVVFDSKELHQKQRQNPEE